MKNEKNISEIAQSVGHKCSVGIPEEQACGIA